MRVFTHCRVAFAVRFFGKPFMKLHGLAPSPTDSDPTFFYGCYSEADFQRIFSHRGPGLVSWCGADALKINKPRLKKFLARPHIKHLAKSRDLAADLARIGIPHKRINLHGSDLSGLPPSEPLGKSVYVYLPKGRAPSFSPSVVSHAERKLPGIQFIRVENHLALSRPQLIEVYKSAAIGLRLTHHDGCANTVLEMGMMGRYCVHNGDQPNSIPWRNGADVIRAIKKQVRKAGRVHRWMPAAMKKYLELPRDWLTVEFWE